ncbi:MAG: DUF4405 domain-containing protein [Gemmatimonadota bacterium]
MKIRRIISLTVFLSFIFLALSGIMLFFSPRGRIANWGGWTLFGFTKEEYSAVHTTFMVLFLVTGIWHIVLNWRPIVGYLKDRSKKIRVFTPESSLAMGLALLFLAGPLMGLPLFKQFLDAGEGIKDYWETTQGNPPWGHAEESRLDVFCRRVADFQHWEGEGVMMVDCEEAQAALVAAGMAVEGPSQTVLDIAEVNGVTPQVIADIVLGVARPATPEEIAAGLAGGGGQGRGGGSGSGVGRGAGEGSAEDHTAEAGSDDRFQHPAAGLGRLTFRAYAEDFGYGLEEILGILRVQDPGIEGNDRFRDVADRLGTDPTGVLEILNSGG